jgi:hypothetical protein
MKKILVLLALVGGVVLYFAKLRTPELVVVTSDRVYRMRAPRNQIWPSRIKQSEGTAEMAVKVSGKAVETLPGIGKVSGSAIIYVDLPDELHRKLSPGALLVQFQKSFEQQLTITSEREINGGDNVGRELGFHGKVPFGFGSSQVYGRVRMMMLSPQLVMVFAITERPGGDQDPRLIRQLDTFTVMPR